MKGSRISPCLIVDGFCKAIAVDVSLGYEVMVEFDVAVV